MGSAEVWLDEVLVELPVSEGTRAPELIKVELVNRGVKIQITPQQI